MSQSRVTIYSPSGEQLYAMSAIFENCTEKFTLMQEDYIELHFNLLKPIFFEIGCWAMWNDKKYYVTEFQQPSYDANTGGYGYELKMNAYYLAWGLKMYKYSSLAFDGNESSVALRELKFSLTANLLTQAQTLVRCLNLDGFRWYNAETSKEEEFSAQLWTSDNEEEVDFNEVKTLTYDGVNYVDALKQIADEWSTEWWVQDNVLYFGKCQDNSTDLVEFEQGVNVEKIDGSKSQSDYATRVYAFGSDKNLPKNYGKGDAYFVVSKTIYKQDGNYIQVKPSIYSSYFDRKEQTIVRYTSKCDYLKQEKSFEVKFLSVEESDPEMKFDTSSKFTTTQLPAKDKYTGSDFFRFVNGEESRICFQWRWGADVWGGTNDKFSISVTYTITREQNNEVIATATKKYEANTQKDQAAGTIDIVDLPDFKLAEADKIKIGISFGLTRNFGNRRGSFSIIVPPQVPYIKYRANTLATNVVLNKDDIYKEDATLIMATAEDHTDHEYLEANNIYIRLKENSEIKEHLADNDKIKIDNIINSKLPSWYFDSEKDLQNASAIKAFSEKRLSLPSPYYVDAEENVPFGSIIEKTLTYDDIYPRTETYITDVKTKSEYVKDENSEQTTLQYTDYYIKQNKFTFDNDFKLEGEDKLQIKFVTGALAGLTFDTEYCQDTYPDTSYRYYFKIIRQQMDGGMWLPNNAMHPALADPNNGKADADKFVLIGWDSSRIEDLGLIEAAQNELLAKVKKEIAKMNEDPTTYECTMLSDVMYGRAEETLITDDNGVPITDDRGINIRTDDSPHGLDPSKGKTYKIGQRVRLISGALFKSGERMSRIIGYEKKMDIPWDSPIYQVGEKAIYSTIGDIKNEIKQLKRK